MVVLGEQLNETGKVFWIPFENVCKYIPREFSWVWAGLGTFGSYNLFNLLLKKVENGAQFSSIAF
jgi:hypothetical protein